MSNNQMVSVPLELLKRVAIGYPQAEALALGRSAAIVELGAFLCRAAEQRQGEPVTLPARKHPVRADYSQEPMANGWNACLDEIAKLGQLYSRPAQGEPVAWRYKTRVYVQALGYVWREVIETEAPDLNEVAARDLTPLFTHAAPAEVERLRTELADLRRWEASVRENSPLINELERLRAQLAEAHALLRDLEGKTILSWPDKHRISAALSASAEPSAPDCEGCNDTGYHSSQEPPFLDVVPCTTRGCRTALERKP